MNKEICEDCRYETAIALWVRGAIKRHEKPESIKQFREASEHQRSELLQSMGDYCPLKFEAERDRLRLLQATGGSYRYVKANFNVVGEPPENCPYILEHTVSEDE